MSKPNPPPPYGCHRSPLCECLDRRLDAVAARKCPWFAGFSDTMVLAPPGEPVRPPPAPAGSTRGAILKEAMEVVTKRGLHYGEPEDNFERIARYWRVHLLNRFGLSVPIDEASVALMMDLVKSARLDNEIQHHDSWVDKAGYAAAGAQCVEKMLERAKGVPQ